MDEKEKISLRQVKENALETAQRLLDYKSYGGSDARALTALSKRCPGWEKATLKPWLVKALLLHRDGLLFVEKHSMHMYGLYKSNQPISFYDIGTDFFKKHKSFSRDTINHHLGFIFYYHHLR